MCYIEAMTCVGYQVALFFLLLKFTRGNEGVRVVSEYTLQHWHDFVNHFDVFCSGLLKYCRGVCENRGATYLSHKEGLHTGKSGYRFLDTLSLKSARQTLQSVAQAHLYCFFVFRVPYCIEGFFISFPWTDLFLNPG